MKGRVLSHWLPHSAYQGNFRLSLNAKILGEVETQLSFGFAVCGMTPPWACYFFFIVIQTRLENIHISLFPPVTFIKSLSYSVLYLVQVGIFKEIQHYRYRCCLVNIIPLWSHSYFHRDNHYSEFVVNYFFKLFLFCSYVHVYECMKYIALFHMLKSLRIHTLFYMYTYNVQIIRKHFFLYKISFGDLSLLGILVHLFIYPLPYMASVVPIPWWIRTHFNRYFSIFTTINKDTMKILQFVSFL